MGSGGVAGGRVPGGGLQEEKRRRRVQGAGLQEEKEEEESSRSRVPGDKEKASRSHQNGPRAAGAETLHISVVKMLVLSTV